MAKNIFPGDGCIKYSIWVPWFILGLMVLFAGCVSPTTPTSSTSAPNWFHNLDSPDSALQPIGYGRGATPKEAKRNALLALARQNRVEVEAETQVNAHRDQGEVERQVWSQVNTEVDQKLRGAELVKIKSIGDLYYAAYRLDMRPASQVITHRIREQWSGPLPRKIEWKGPSSLIHGEVVQELEEMLTKSDGNGNRSIRVSLQRNNGRWLFQTGNTVTPLRDLRLERILSFSGLNQNQGSLQLTAQACEGARTLQRLVASQCFTLKLTSTKVNGYFTVFNLYPDGRVAVLADNRPLVERQQIPSRKAQQEQNLVFIARSANSGKSAQEIYLAIHTRSHLDTASFPKLSLNKGLVEGKTTYKLNRFLRWLDRQQLEDITWLKVRIKPAG